MEQQKISNSQSTIEKEEQHWRYQAHLISNYAIKL